MAFVAPSILAADFANLERDCRRVITAQNPFLHFDVMDGVFVPNISVGLPVLASLKKALPEAVFDVHLMIQRPGQYVDAFAKAGADYITIHIEAEGDAAETLAAIRKAGCKAGLSLRPGTPVEALYPLLPLADMVLVMSVEPGFGGQQFLPEAPGRIRAVKQAAAAQGLNLLVEVDGGINRETAPLCLETGVDILVAGSAVFRAADPGAEVQALLGRM